MWNLARDKLVYSIYNKIYVMLIKYLPILMFETTIMFQHQNKDKYCQKCGALKFVSQTCAKKLISCI